MPGGVWRPLLWFGIMCLNMHTIFAGFERICTGNERPHPQGICGSYIPETLHLLCMGSYNIPVKRDNDYQSNYRDHLPRLSPLQGIIIGKRDAFSYLGGHRGHREVGIVCECCYNQCAYDELQQYCDFRKKRDVSSSSRLLIEDKSNLND
ncbi:hypothetical protein FSP39_001578 [Pinctada imbricata]|uniref:Insulin-like domain-containing protein n=1 Tax=Pinctada imbricata TaxID=66713 RepID=A0AA89BW48_PINIB|nr:hypothetical protein FSP39_001578 [Pinctada imbricata]